MGNLNYGWMFIKDNQPGVEFADLSRLASLTKFETLVRELIQNSVDARIGDQAELVVEDGAIELDAIQELFKLGDIQKQIQGTLDLMNSFGTNERLKSRIKGQLQMLAGESIRYLKFSDYKTKGLKGLRTMDKSTALFKLIFDQGTSDGKNSSSAGGVGVGKNAVFPFSAFSTVIYVTQTDEGRGYTGTSHLYSSRINGMKFVPNGHLVAYEDYNKCINGEEYGRAILDSDVDFDSSNLLNRSENGTDVIILGTDRQATLCDEKWYILFALYAIKNFYLGIRNNTFSLTIKPSGKQPIVINKETLNSVIDGLEKYEELSIEISECFRFVRLLSRTMNPIEGQDSYRKLENTFPEIGDVTLYMNASSDVTDKRWYLFRSFGMKTIDKKVSTQKPVFAVAFVKTPKGSDYLLRAESGNHIEYDFLQYDDTQGREVKKNVDDLENWITKMVRSFGQIDTVTTDIELAGLSSFISLPDGTNTGESDEGVTPMLELITPKTPSKQSKRKPRKRDTGHEDPNGTNTVEKSEDWDHDPDGHKNWDHERNTKKEEVPVSENGGSLSYDKTIQLKSTIRDIHKPFSSEVELVGLIHNKGYAGKKVDITILAINELNQINDYLPSIVSAIDLETGEKLNKIEDGHIIKDVPIDNDLRFHLRVTFAAQFRSSLIETASVTHHIAMNAEENVNESAE